MSEQHPDVRWAPIPPKPSNRGRIWLIVGLSVLAIAIVAALLFFLLPRGGSTEPGASATPTPSASASPGPTSSPTESGVPTPSDQPVDPETPVSTPPAPADPDIATFRSLVTPRLDDAQTGLGFAADASSAQETASIAEQLQIDAQQLSDLAPPASIDAKWRAAVSEYSTRLETVRTTGTDAAIESARGALDDLRSLVG